MQDQDVHTQSVSWRSTIHVLVLLAELFFCALYCRSTMPIIPFTMVFETTKGATTTGQPMCCLNSRPVSEQSHVQGCPHTHQGAVIVLFLGLLMILLSWFHTNRARCAPQHHIAPPRRPPMLQMC